MHELRSARFHVHMLTGINPMVNSQARCHGAPSRIGDFVTIGTAAAMAEDRWRPWTAGYRPDANPGKRTLPVTMQNDRY